MSFGLSGAAVAGLAVGSSGILSSIFGGNAASKAAQQQAAAQMAALAQQKQEFAQIQQLLSPFVQQGQGALTMQGNIAGANGNAAQQAAISAMQNSPIFQGLNQQGQDAILANSSATGGLRGGNTNAALAQFSPSLLNSLLQQQFGNLGSLSALGENAAAMQGNLGQQNTNQVSGLLSGIGQAQAGGTLGQAQAFNQGLNSIVQGLGVYKGLSATPGMGSLGSLLGSGSGYTPTGWAPTVVNTF